jgi:4-hydroxy-3-methylbut-2-enyl diphosphate reductase
MSGDIKACDAGALRGGTQDGGGGAPYGGEQDGGVGAPRGGTQDGGGDQKARVILAKTAGFCFGVERAVGMVYALLEDHSAPKPICTYGPIIHNEQVVGDLENKGVVVIPSQEALGQIENGTVVIRSHGAPKGIYGLLEAKGITVVDATCPFVQRIHRLVEEQNGEGRRVVIIGDGAHPEVEGIRGWGREDTIVLSSEAEIDGLALKSDEKIAVVAQTTFHSNKFHELVEKISKRVYDIHVLNTICNATQERQLEAQRIAKEADLMLVIGGRESSNTRKLFEICRRECKDTYYIQTLGDFHPESVKSVGCIGIIAGASTPKKIIEEVYTDVRTKF